MRELKLSRSHLCLLIREKSVSGKKAQIDYVLANVLKEVEATYDADVRAVKQTVSVFCSEYFSKLKKANNNYEYLKSRFSVWFSGVVDFVAAKKSDVADKKGRPSMSFESTTSDRTKRLKTEDLREAYSASCLLYAASVKFREEGEEKCAKLLKQIHETPSLAGEILDHLSKKNNENDPVKMSGEEALSLVLDADLSKGQYSAVRTCSKGHKADIFPPYNFIVEEKKAVFPIEAISVSEKCAEVSLQILLDQNSNRLFQLLERTADPVLVDIPDGAVLEFHHKYGSDGSGDHSTYQQGFEDAPATQDQCVLLTALSSLQLRMERPDGLPPLIVWSNPTPSSVRFCKPVRLQLINETKESLKEEHNYLEDQLKC